MVLILIIVAIVLSIVIFSKQTESASLHDAQLKSRAEKEALKRANIEMREAEERARWREERRSEL